MYKEMLVRMAAAAVCLWYLLCITGFDVHTCLNADRSFVVSAIEERFGCSDIHPQQSCYPDMDADACHEEHCAKSAEPVPGFNATHCCTDDFQQFEVICARNDSFADGGTDVLVLHALAQAAMVMELLSYRSSLPSFALEDVRLQTLCPEDLLSQYRIFRI